MLELGGRRKPRPDTPHTAWRNEAFRGYADYMDTPEFAAAAEELASLARTDNVAVDVRRGCVVALSPLDDRGLFQGERLDGVAYPGDGRGEGASVHGAWRRWRAGS